MAQRTSGNPAKQAQIERNARQQREQRAQEKLTEHQRQVARRQRTKRLAWIGGSVAAVAVVAAIVTLYVTAPEPLNEYDAGGSGAEIAGVETFDLSNEHVETEVDYEQTPAAGGPHYNAWLNCGVYTEPQIEEHVVHSLEHGAVWLAYDPDLVSDADIDRLEQFVPSSYAVMSPYSDMGAPIALSAWNHQLKVDSADDERIPQFFEEFWRSDDVPEPGALCTGAIDGPGKAS